MNYCGMLFMIIIIHVNLRFHIYHYSCNQIEPPTHSCRCASTFSIAVRTTTVVRSQRQSGLSVKKDHFSSRYTTREVMWPMEVPGRDSLWLENSEYPITVESYLSELQFVIERNRGDKCFSILKNVTVGDICLSYSIAMHWFYHIPATQ